MYYIGVDLGGTNIAAGVVDENCKILAKGSVPTGNTRTFAEIIKDMATLCSTLLEEANLTVLDIQAIGVACPGTPDTENGKVLWANNLLSFTNVSVKDALNQYFPNTAVYVENDANAAAYGEIIGGAAKGEDNAIVVTLGTGIGGGIIIDGKICAGFNHGGAELGHMVIVADGEPCTCGLNGCWEAYGSVTALIRQTKEKISEYPESIIHKMIAEDVKVSGRTAFDAMRAGDAAGKAIVDQYIRYIGIGLVNLVNIFQPKKVVIGGGISKEGETLLAPLREYVAGRQYCSAIPDFPSAEIVAAELGNDAGIIGAAMLYKQH